MSRPHRLPRVALATEISLLVAASLVAPTWTTAPASATVAEPAVVSSAVAPTGLLANSPWIVDSAGTQWAYGTTTSLTGTLIARNSVTGATTTLAMTAGDEGSLGAAYSTLTNVAVFSAKRSGVGNRMTAFDLTTGTRLSSRALAVDENNVRAITFNSTAAYYLVGTNTNPAKILKIDVATGSLHSSATLATGLKDITAFVPNGTDAYAAVNTSPVKLVPFSKSTLAQSSSVTLPASVPTVVDPVLAGSVAYFGTDASPGRITAFDLTTKTVLGSVVFSTEETGARHLVADTASGVLYATTATPSGTRIVSVRLSDLARQGTTELTASQPVTAVFRRGNRLDVHFAGDGGSQILSTAPAPDAPANVSVTESDRSLTVTWTPGASVEPILDYTATATGDGQVITCTTATTACDLTGLANGIDYEIAVTARSLAGSSVAATGTGNPFTHPEAPLAPTVNRGDRSLAVTWSEPGDGGRAITGYVATASPGGQSCATADTTCVISGLTNGVPHTVRVVARNIGGDSEPSDPSTESTPATIPGSPRNLGLVSRDAGTIITWVAPADDGGGAIIAYRVRVWVDATVVRSIETVDISATVDGLSNGTEYSVTVTALNSMGESESSSPAWVTPEAPAPPVPPVVEPPIVEPPVVEPPVVEPPIVEPPIVEPPIQALAPASPTAITVLAHTRSRVTVGWVLLDSGSFPVTDYRVETSRFRDRRFTALNDAVGSTPWVSIRKPKHGSLFVRVIAVNAAGESRPSGSRRVVRG